MNQITAKAKIENQMINERQVKNKAKRDATKVKKDISALVGDNTALLGRFEDNLNQAAVQAKGDLTTWMEDGVTHMNEEFGKLTDDTKESMSEAAASVKKEVGDGITHYNARAQELADKIPDGFSRKAAKYPWVAITIDVAVGFLLGSLIKPIRTPLW
jgi:ElaB/YqjD/DUF883 family membrane-anchored ribosome-binding protein